MVTTILPDRGHRLKMCANYGTSSSKDGWKRLFKRLRRSRNPCILSSQTFEISSRAIQRSSEFRPGVRPIARPGDDAIIVNACESAPYRIARHVKEHDRFCIKSQPFSMAHILANDSLAPMFAGGTIYQAFLSPLSYQRWHSPVSGTVHTTGADRRSNARAPAPPRARYPG